MSSCIYGGTYTLPAPPADWDRETYPYALIWWYSNSTIILYVFDKNTVYNNPTSNKILPASTTYIQSWVTSKYDDSWGTATYPDRHEFDSYINNKNNVVVWSNFDILNSDGSTYLKGTDFYATESSIIESSFLNGLTLGLCGKGTPENLAVEGKIGSTPLGQTMTAFQASFVEEAIERYFDESYSGVIIAETDTLISAIFIQDDFEILTHDPVTTDYTAQGHTVVTWSKETDEWDMEDWRDSASTGGNYSRNFVYADRYVLYDDCVIYPLYTNLFDQTAFMIGYKAGGELRSMRKQKTLPKMTYYYEYDKVSDLVCTDTITFEGGTRRFVKISDDVPDPSIWPMSIVVKVERTTYNVVRTPISMLIQYGLVPETGYITSTDGKVQYPYGYEMVVIATEANAVLELVSGSDPASITFPEAGVYGWYVDNAVGLLALGLVVPSVIASYDGDSTGKVTVNVDDTTYVKISDNTPISLIDGMLTTSMDGSSQTMAITSVDVAIITEGAYCVLNAIYVIPESAVGVDINGVSFPEAGIWFDITTTYNCSITITVVE